MADTFKVLAQSNPSATTSTSIYTAPSAVSVSSIVVCNQAALQATFRISVAVANASSGVAASQYLFYDVPIPGNDTFVCTIGITLASTDQVYVYSSSATLSFAMFGAEIS